MIVTWLWNFLRFILRDRVNDDNEGDVFYYVIFRV